MKRVVRVNGVRLDGSPRSIGSLALGIVLAASACGAPDPGPGGGPPPVARPAACADLDFPSGFAQSASGLVNASKGPLLPLTEGQEQAFVAVWSVVLDELLCSGTLVGPRLVLTAEHCVSSGDMEIRFGPEARAAEEVIPVQALRPHPQLDLALLELARAPATEATPIALATHEPTPSLVDTWLETAGFGKSLEGFDQRAFLPVRVQSVTTDFLDVQGGGRQGLCFGDSGAPLLTRDPARRDVRVWGVLSEGDVDCLGLDRFALIRRAADFFAEEATSGSGPPTCGELSVEGGCTLDGHRVDCGSSGTRFETCPESCGWDGARFACLAASSSSCREGCEGEVLRWCDRDRTRARDCAACGERCVEANEGAYCTHPVCAELGGAGRCARDVVEWCDDAGRFRQFDCQSVGQRCLPDPARCVSVPEDCRAIGRGRCSGDTRLYCEGSTVRWESCPAAGERCIDGECA